MTSPYLAVYRVREDGDFDFVAVVDTEQCPYTATELICAVKCPQLELEEYISVPFDNKQDCPDVLDGRAAAILLS